jgi:hypothetical protein
MLWRFQRVVLLVIPIEELESLLPKLTLALGRTTLGGRREREEESKSKHG